jgi:hypothetical protein
MFAVMEMIRIQRQAKEGVPVAPVALG